MTSMQLVADPPSLSNETTNTGSTMTEADWGLAKRQPRTHVLANLRGINDADQLRDIEFALAHIRQQQIERGEIPIRRTYGTSHLVALHRHLFGALYGWAGKVRSYQLTKARTVFAAPRDIEDYLDAANRLIVETDWDRLDHDAFADEAARVFAYLNTAHPFREGNGRATKLFMRQLANDHGWDLRYDLVGPEEWNRASELAGPEPGSFEPVPDALFSVFRTILVPLPDR